ncbi:hypothetical protein P9578_06805 [Brevibacillus choshinensis]|uniref:hypothetical protein n=1 Tax=Brevibacillus choshinensis TaxID=54911 RepID=UPI002E1DB3F7|nr:hypothetical protein [Brevibacillus choshinensis]
MSYPRSEPDYWLIRPYEAALEMLRGQMSQDAFMIQFVDENSWPENPLLMYYRKTYKLMVKSLSLKNRRKYFFKASHLTYQCIREMYGYGNARIQKYLNMEQDKTDTQFIAELAIIHRIPPLWLEYEEVNDEWETYHFHSIGNSPKTIEDLLSILTSLTMDDSWVRGFILSTTNSRNLLHLRLESQNGNLLIEINNRKARPADIAWLLSNLKDYKLEIGKIITVIPSHDILAIVCKRNSIPFCLPIGFNSLN